LLHAVNRQQAAQRIQLRVVRRLGRQARAHLPVNVVQPVTKLSAGEAVTEMRFIRN
jgi:hypothetical protein